MNDAPIPRSTADRARDAWLRAMPGVFVLLWSTGFIGAKFGLPYAEPMTFLALRFAIASVLLALIATVVGARWPRTWREAGHAAIAGLLVQGLYLGGVFAAIALGVEAGVSALIAGLQPLLVAALAGIVLGERVGRLQWLGLVFGLCGTTLVVWQKLAAGIGTPAGVALCFAALIGIAAGTLYQKRFCHDINLLTGNAIQFAASLVPVGLLALAFETGHIAWTGEFAFALGWLVLVLSLGGVALYYVLIRRGAAARVASLFFLVPGATAALAYLLFGETFGPLSLAGIALTALGVALANRRPPPPR